MRSVLGLAESAVLKYVIQSHELRTPLNAIIGLTEMMVKDEASASEG
jgi:signal transduction histidine kinase